MPQQKSCVRMSYLPKLLDDPDSNDVIRRVCHFKIWFNWSKVQERFGFTTDKSSWLHNLRTNYQWKATCSCTNPLCDCYAPVEGYWMHAFLRDGVASKIEEIPHKKHVKNHPIFFLVTDEHCKMPRSKYGRRNYNTRNIRGQNGGLSITVTPARSSSSTPSPSHTSSPFVQHPSLIDRSSDSSAASVASSASSSSTNSSSSALIRVVPLGNGNSSMKDVCLDIEDEDRPVVTPNSLTYSFLTPKSEYAINTQAHQSDFTFPAPVTPQGTDDEIPRLGRIGQIDLESPKFNGYDNGVFSHQIHNISQPTTPRMPMDVSDNTATNVFSRSQPITPMMNSNFQQQCHTKQEIDFGACLQRLEAMRQQEIIVQQQQRRLVHPQITNLQQIPKTLTRSDENGNFSFLTPSSTTTRTTTSTSRSQSSSPSVTKFQQEPVTDKNFFDFQTINDVPLQHQQDPDISSNLSFPNFNAVGPFTFPSLPLPPFIQQQQEEEQKQQQQQQQQQQAVNPAIAVSPAVAVDGMQQPPQQMLPSLFIQPGEQLGPQQSDVVMNDAGVESEFDDEYSQFPNFQSPYFNFTNRETAL